ncbi:cutinase family protein [Mycolicibacter sp. MYC123]|uniref:Cutinase n=2 Tax=Mycolicibacter TaxID=1073531 RepID=A0ABU5YMC0_9MYCO|nr:MULTISPECIES: cutinase family protein [unclassified Mycolicibacter]MEB3051199.1 cutinase family protein [Mycolicibacter sp. MYC123]MEB3061492.1 cutinase family protein [Mycolicibacter sp. MYC101]MEB3067829.1 cutinase family protein [Mycolicibacter sp. MYC017]
MSDSRARTFRLAGRGTVLAAVLLTAPIVIPAGTVAPAGAACPDAEVVFARGRLESPGAGAVGNAFVSALRAKTSKNVSVYAVNYPADNQVDQGANDMSAHIQKTINGCPNTRIVPGGYSLGAAVTDVVLAVPFSAFGFTNPLPPGADEHIAAVALFGNGSQWVGPITNFSPVYNDRTIEQCHGADPICNPADPNTWEENWPQHLAGAYISSGMVNQAADFVAGKL